MPGLIYQFGNFRLDCGRFELLQNGRSLRVERKPMELLILLVSRESQLVNRAEIAERLWSGGVFVDTEHGINTAIRKLRHLLRDDPENPKYIQTVTGMGYRFIAPTAAIDEPAAEDAIETPTAESSTLDAASASEPAAGRASKRPLVVHIANVARFIVLAVLFIVLGIGPHQLAGGLLHRNPDHSINSLAVLPLDNLTGDPNQEYFTDGMTDELITMLAKDSTLRITSRTSVMQYKGARKPLPEIARALNVDGVLEGSISRVNGQVHMTLQLIRADTDTHLWAESYDRDNADVATLPHEAAQAIAMRLHSAVSAPSHPHSTSPAAHDAYLRGRYFLQKREVSKSAAYFRQAVSNDPSWSQAYSGLASAIQSEGVFGILSPEETIADGEDAARRAIDLDPQNGEAYSTLGLIQASFGRQWADAEANLKHGIVLNPSSSEAEFAYVIYLDAVDRPAEAVAYMRKALTLDPASFMFNRHLGSALLYNRQYDEALVYLRQAAEMEPGRLNFVYGWESKVYEMKGMRDKAVECDTALIQYSDPEASKRLRAIYKEKGWRGYWEARQQWMLARQNETCASYEIGVNYIRLGETDRAFPYLDRAVDQKCWEASWIMVDPLADKIRTDRRYYDLLQKMKLPL